MGKAILIIVLGAGLFVARGFLGSQETAQRTTMEQVSYEENVLAREIARSGFNVAMGRLRQFGDSLHHGVNAINGADGYMEGDYQGGTFRVRVEPITGSSVEVISTGYFGGAFDQHGEYAGGAIHRMDDLIGRYDLPTPPLSAKECSHLETRFLQSVAGYCSAVYLQRSLLGVPDDEQPEPEMIFAAGHNRNGSGMTVDKYIQAGTQMNFFIGVDQNCSTKPPNWMTYDVENHTFNPHDYDHIHYALTGNIDDLGRMEESIWGLIEQHPQNNQRWRIAWEDQHLTKWDKPNSNNPQESLQATKRLGYRGNGWPTADAWGYRTLEDFGNQPDFSDQVIDVSLSPVASSLCEPIAQAEIPEEPEEPEDPTLEPEDPEESMDSPLCKCNNGKPPKNGKLAVMHRPPGNPANEHVICISESGWLNGHIGHDDYVVCRSN